MNQWLKRQTVFTTSFIKRRTIYLSMYKHVSSTFLLMSFRIPTLRLDDYGKNEESSECVSSCTIMCIICSNGEAMFRAITYVYLYYIYIYTKCFGMSFKSIFRRSWKFRIPRIQISPKQRQVRLWLWLAESIRRETPDENIQNFHGIFKCVQRGFDRFEKQSAKGWRT